VHFADHYIQQPALPPEALDFPVQPGGEDVKLKFALKNNYHGSFSYDPIAHFNSDYIRQPESSKNVPGNMHSCNWKP
jgi:hypothetical protein